MDREEQQRAKGQYDLYHSSKIPWESVAVYMSTCMDVHVCRVFMNDAVHFHSLFYYV